MSQREGDVFGALMSKQGWVCYHLPQGPGGLYTLVRSSLKSSRVRTFASAGGQGLVVQVGPVVVCNLYGAHRRDKPWFMQDIYEFVQSLYSDPWVVVGDFNDIPSECPLSLGLLASSGANLIVPPSGVSSRWKSSRAIDYVVTSCASPHESLSMCEERWSDHRGFLCSLTTDALDGLQERCELVPCLTYLPKELERIPEWTAFLDIAWNAYCNLSGWNGAPGGNTP